MAASEENVQLHLVQINVWSGSKYNLNWTTRKFDSYESESARTSRFDSLVSQLKVLDPDVITLNEAMPCEKYVKALAEALDYDYCFHIGVAGIIVGPIHFPSKAISEGDAILCRRDLCMQYLGRRRLTGNVFSNQLSLNTDDATQAIACSIQKNGKNIVVVATHWQAGVLEDENTLLYLESLRSSGDFSDEETKLGEMAIKNGTKIRTSEANGCLDFINMIKRSHFDQKDVTFVLAGDLNSTIGTPEMKVIENSGFHLVKLPEGSITWDVSNPNVQVQSEPERSDVRGKVEQLLYDNFSKSNSLLDHLFIKTMNCKPEPREDGTYQYEAEICLQYSGDNRAKVIPSDHYGLQVLLYL